MRWMKRRHPEKNISWLHKKYFRSQGLRNWVFSTNIKSKEGKVIILDLFAATSVKIKRHIKIRGNANPFDYTWKDYFEKRDKRNKINPRDVGQDVRHLPIF
jgi:RNA-directed DNA polymerase